MQRILVYGRQRTNNPDFVDTVHELVTCLLSYHCDVTLEEATAEATDLHHLPSIPLDEADKNYDLLIVVGGDGSLLQAARVAARHYIPIVGINRGRLGFLTDIHPLQVEEKITAILQGQFKKEQRFLLDLAIEHRKKITPIGTALNDIVLLPGHIAHMIEFSILIDDLIVCVQRADGLITATPTGSTAYALSGGGPILHPQLNAIVLVPMFPHTLSSRPLVVDNHSHIKIALAQDMDTQPYVSYDGCENIQLQPGDILHIHKSQYCLNLLHPLDYDYYQTLRTKLGWQMQM